MSGKTMANSKGAKTGNKKAPKNGATENGIKSAKSAKSAKKRRTHLLRLCTEMNNHAIDANDKEIIKRFKTTITSSEEDISRSALDQIIHRPQEVEMDDFSESVQPYVKHYVFMNARKKGNNSKSKG